MAMRVTPSAGERAIAVYKFVKGAAQLVGAATLVVLLATGGTAELPSIAARIRHLGSSALAIKTAAIVAAHVTARDVWLTVGALAVDGVVTSIEGWALHTGRWWGRWIVVIATGSLIPFEIAAIARHPTNVLRIAVLAINVVIVAYLAWHAWKHHVTARRGRLARA